MSSKIDDARRAFEEVSAAFIESAAAMVEAASATGPDAEKARAQSVAAYMTAKADLTRAEEALAEAEREDDEARSAKSKKVSIAERAGQMICPECGGPVERKSKHGPTPIFCSPEHRRAFNNRAMADGAGVIAYLKAWRVDRGSGPIARAAFSRMCTIADSYNFEDAQAKPPRPRADLYAAKLIGNDFQTVDDRRYGIRKRREGERRKAAQEANEGSK